MKWKPVSERPVLIQMSVTVEQSLLDRFRALSKATKIPMRQYMDTWLEQKITEQEDLLERNGYEG